MPSAHRHRRPSICQAVSTESFLSNKGPENEEISQEAYCMSDAEKKEEEHKEEEEMMAS